MPTVVARVIVFVAVVFLVALPAIAHRGERRTGELRREKGLRERLLLAFLMVAFFAVLVWIVTPFLAFADYPQRLTVLIGGVVLLAVGLVLLYRSHRDLGPHWSITLELGDGHEMVRRGLYRHLRHPMYLAVIVYGAGQALVVPNWIAGPLYLVAVAVMIALRIGAEERMMTEAFGEQYRAYAAVTKRLVPWLW
jgi:protein-S-isoprenylcysteine O-methyltransferase Ste14